MRCLHRVVLTQEVQFIEHGGSVYSSLFCTLFLPSSRVSYRHTRIKEVQHTTMRHRHKKGRSVSYGTYYHVYLTLAVLFCLDLFEYRFCGKTTTTVVSIQQSNNGSIALIIASVWTGIIHLALGVLGTFVLKRFPTSFSVGFFLGVLVVLANQNIILFASFHKYTQGSTRSNQVFASLGLVLFIVLSFMSLLLVHFKQEVVVSPMDGLEEDVPVPQSERRGQQQP